MKNKEKKSKISFIKIFALTILLLLLMSTAAILLFSREFLLFYHAEQQRQINHSFQPILSAFEGRDRSIDEITELAWTFARENQSFSFVIHEGDGNVLFSTPDRNNLGENTFLPETRIRFMGMSRNQDGERSTYILTGNISTALNIDYNDLVRRLFLAVFLMLIIAIFGAVLFAKKITKPLEDELQRERIMEENQRLFFSAASHELKTPIASARALVEAMIAGVGDYKDHNRYLRECLNTLDSQAEIVLRILEIVKLSDEGMELNLFPVDLSIIGNKVLLQYRALADKEAIDIQGEFPQVKVLANVNLLELCFSNVFANAIQNTESGEAILIESENLEIKSNKMLRLKITNTGAKIKGAYDTNGFGLTIVKKALDRMKLRYALENTPIGVQFSMDLQILQEKFS